MPETTTPTDQTSPRDAGHTTSENFWTKVTMILGSVIAVAGFLGEGLTAIMGVLPAGGTAFRIFGIVGAAVALISKISYEISRTLIKMKIVQAEAAAAAKPPESLTPGDAAADVLGSDAPGGTP